MRLLLPTLRASWSRLKSSEPASTNAARHRSSSWFRSGFRDRRILPLHVPHGTLNEPLGTSYHRRSSHEASRRRTGFFSGPGHLGYRHDLLCISRPSYPGNDGNPLLGELRDFAYRVHRAVHRDSEVASHLARELGCRDASLGYSGNDWRSRGAVSPDDVHAEAPRRVGREVRGVSLRYLRNRARFGRGCYASIGALIGGTLELNSHRYSLRLRGMSRLRLRARLLPNRVIAARLSSFC